MLNDFESSPYPTKFYMPNVMNRDFAVPRAKPLPLDGKFLAGACEAALLLVLVVVIHAIVLRYVFPGFYAPTLFEHSDFYAPLALRYSGGGIASMALWPRPVGTMFLYACGWLGTEGFIVAVLAIIFANIIITAMLIRRICGIELGSRFLLCFSLYVFCLVAQPYFLTFATHDVLAQLSYLLLILGLIVTLTSPTGSISALMGMGLLATLAFLSKEAFALSFFGLLAIVGITRRRSGLVAACAPVAVGIAAFLLAMLQGALVKSVFTTGSGDPAGAYRQTENIAVMAGQFIRYLEAGFPSGVIVAIVLTCGLLLILLPARFRVILGALAGAGFAVIIPNCTLPNHFFPGYSWNMGYFLFAPILLFPLVRNRFSPRIAGIVGLVFSVLMMIALPHFWRHAYTQNDWTLQQAAIQRNMRDALDVLTQSAALGQDHRRVLVTGLNGMFSPFDQGEAIREWVGHSDAQFDVVAYLPRPSTAASVHFVLPSEVRIEGYTDVWAFSGDGTGTEITGYSGYPELGFLGKRDIILYPDALGALGSAHYARLDGGPNADQFLMCGIKLVAYHAYDLAIAAFDRSIAVRPANPYAYFYEAQAYEALGRLGEAVKAARQAVESDTKTSVNPYFGQLADRLERDAAGK